MANATSITLTEFLANTAAGVADPTAQVLDTGTAAVTLETADLAGSHDRVVIRVQNTAVANLTVTAVAGAAADNPPALRQGLGDLTSGNIAQNAVRWFGPFEAARFAEGGGKLKMTFTPASGTITANFQAFRLPKSA